MLTGTMAKMHTFKIPRANKMTKASVKVEDLSSIPRSHRKDWLPRVVLDLHAYMHIQNGM